MPADSDPGTRLPALPRTWRPLGPRVVGIAVTLALVAVVAVGWFTFDDETRARFTWFQRGTLVFFGLIYLALMLALTRSRAVAYADRLVVVNGYRRHEYEWPQIVAARLPPGRAVGDPRPRRRRDRLGAGHPGLRRQPRPHRPPRAQVTRRRRLRPPDAPVGVRSHPGRSQPSRRRDYLRGRAQSRAWMPQVAENSWPGASMRRSSPVRKASAWAVIGSTATARRWASVASSAV